MIIKKLLHICLTSVFLLNMFGCATKKALEAMKKEAFKPIVYRKIVKVHPTAIRENDNIKICVELSCNSDECKDKYFQVTLPFQSLASGTIEPEKRKLLKSSKSNLTS